MSVERRRLTSAAPRTVCGLRYFSCAPASMIKAAQLQLIGDERREIGRRHRLPLDAPALQPLLHAGSAIAS